ncbi:hypothetical protein KUCAC02_012565, partial [Chaenocephalus aceratus]
GLWFSPGAGADWASTISSTSPHVGVHITAECPTLPADRLALAFSSSGLSSQLSVFFMHLDAVAHGDGKTNVFMAPPR